MKTTCECSMAGYCKRHAATKSESQFISCQNSEQYFNAWEAARKSQLARSKRPKKSERMKPRIVSGLSSNRSVPAGPELWKEAHTYRFTTKVAFDQWFAYWCKRVNAIPKCSCRKHFNQIVLPSLGNVIGSVSSQEDCFRLFFEMHNMVNLKLSKPELTIQEAKRLWSASTPPTD